MKAQLLILTECGRDIGFGHIVRCKALADAFALKNVATRILVRGDGAIACSSNGTQIEARDWLATPSEMSVNDAATDCVIVDSFEAPLTFVTSLQTGGYKVAVIDDFLRREYSAGIVVDWTLNAETFAYPTRHPKVTYLLGSRFCALRKEFMRASVIDVTQRRPSCLVTFGGSDPRRLTRTIVSLLEMHYPDLEKIVLVGEGFVDRLGDVEMGKGKIVRGVTAAELAGMMGTVQFAICAGGQTLYELASMGTPSLSVSVASNQSDDITECARTGFSKYVGAWDNSATFVNIVDAIRNIRNPQTLQGMSKAGQAAIDGKGAERLAAVIYNSWFKGDE